MKLALKYKLLKKSKGVRVKGAAGSRRGTDQLPFQPQQLHLQSPVSESTMFVRLEGLEFGYDLHWISHVG